MRDCPTINYSESTLRVSFVKIRQFICIYYRSKSYFPIKDRKAVDTNLDALFSGKYIYIKLLGIWLNLLTEKLILYTNDDKLITMICKTAIK